MATASHDALFFFTLLLALRVDGCTTYSWQKYLHPEDIVCATKHEIYPDYLHDSDVEDVVMSLVDTARKLYE
ncbi:hypothetical protein EJB05_14129, partial [Eragrostis curvula]